MSATLPELRANFPTRQPNLRGSSRPSALALWHLLSLDAPSIAALWTWFIAATHVQLPPASVAAMFLAVWILYIGDRLLDARRFRSARIAQLHFVEGDMEERHHFHARHRAAFLRAALLAGLVLSASLTGMPSRALRLYAVLGTLLAIYFLLIHALDGERRLPKELAVGVFFSAAVFVPTVAGCPELRVQLLPLALLFAALCSVNCLRILAWERPGAVRPRAAALTSAPGIQQPLHPITRTALGVLAPFHCGVALVAVILAISQRSPVSAAIALSAVALWILHAFRHHLSRVHLRAAADLALATPLPLLLLGLPWR